MNLQSYLNSLPVNAQKDYATRVGTSLGYLRKAISRRQEFGPQLAVSLEHESGKLVTRQELLPNTWHLIWPELRQDIFGTLETEDTSG